MSHRPVVFLSVALLISCGGVSDPAKVRDKPISALSGEDIQGICAYNTRYYREKVPAQEWNTHHCALATMASIAMTKKLKPVSHDECLQELATCLVPSSEEVWTPEHDCERVDVDNAQACGATVGELQECIVERTAAVNKALPIIRSGGLCDAAEPLQDLNILSGPACMKLKARCGEFRLALPGFIRAIK
jgi:hypothetical protein